LVRGGKDARDINTHRLTVFSRCTDERHYGNNRLTVVAFRLLGSSASSRSSSRHFLNPSLCLAHYSHCFPKRGSTFHQLCGSPTPERQHDQNHQKDTDRVQS